MEKFSSVRELEKRENIIVIKKLSDHVAKIISSKIQLQSINADW